MVKRNLSLLGRKFRTAYFVLFFLLEQPLPSISQTYPPETPLTYIAMPKLPKPGYLKTFADPVFGTNVTRIGDVGVFSPTTRPRHHYAKDQPWNSNGTLIRMDPHRDFEIIDAVTLRHVRTIPAVRGASVWSNTNPNLIYGTSVSKNPSHPAHNTFYKQDVTTGKITVIQTFPAYTEVSLGSYEGNMSNDDRYATFQCKKSSGDTEIIVYDLVNEVVVSTLNIGTIWPNNVCMSQSGEYVMIQLATNGTTSTTGTCVYTKNLAFVRNVSFSAGMHYDVGYDTEGNEVVVQQSTANDRSVTTTRMDNGKVTTILTREQMSFPIHISCRNIKRPGWAYFTEFQADGTLTKAPNYQQIFAVKLDGSGIVNSYAHVHHSEDTTYEHSPFGVPNRDGTVVMWRSDWGKKKGEAESYIASMAQATTIGPQGQQPEYQTMGHKDKLPLWYKKLADRQTFPLSWEHAGQGSFNKWNETAKAKVKESFMAAPPLVAFDTKVIAEEDRGSYIARKIAFNITGDSRVLALMLLPKSAGPHPAILLLHDHGGRYDIGKEKVIKPFGIPEAKKMASKDWVESYYGGRYIGDQLAKLGYVCLSVDMLNWSDRSGENPYEVQQALASNFLHLGASWPGLIAYEDMRAAEFLARQKEVDSTKIAAIGLSVGGYRTWQVAAMSPNIAAGVSVCWMSTYAGLMTPGSNQTKGHSAYSMLHPGLAQFLDYPDVASIACPKPMMFCNGNIDPLFPVQSIKDAYAKMQKVWNSQNAGENLVTKLYDAPHEFSLSMQKDAFNWLNVIFKQPVQAEDKKVILK